MSEDRFVNFIEENATKELDDEFYPIARILYEKYVAKL